MTVPQTSGDWTALVGLTLRDPAAAAQTILRWHIPREALWMALALVAAINSLVFGLSNLIAPAPIVLPALFTNPLMFFLLVASGLVLTVHAFYWTGRMLGGRGDLADLLVLLIWLQALRACVQLAVVVFSLVLPLLAVVLVVAGSILSMWILLHFLSQALNLGSLWRALTVLVAASVALVLGLSFLLSIIGVTAMGIPANV